MGTWRRQVFAASTYSRPYQFSLLFRLNEWFARALQVSFFITDCFHVGLVGEAVPRCGVFYHLCLGTLPKVTGNESLDKLLIAKPLSAGTLALDHSLIAH